ncbi:prepilin peptidase [Steroidobacter sp. S1-65]|uniref:Prepilin leader peptidase/N-methyltransferase n=1 Tax=Steroidobacter gossypii TaxID=2805490 RepID=A0ABS1WR53_9GAMM|nr:A24 family peptidase [Steroidobacter gossypii]MBM0103456.1 prepilin peptidase [Steroidobacter gossypii]
MQEVFGTLQYLLAASPTAWIVSMLVLGLLVGSFLNVVIHRLPIMMEREWQAQAHEILGPNAYDPPRAEPIERKPYNLLVPRSACPKCGALITALQNVPVISYLFLRGACANCGTKISIRYPLIELFTGVLSAAVAWKFGVSWYCGAALLLTWALVALSAIDFDHQLLPDQITLPLLWLGLLLSLAPTLPSSWLPADSVSSIVGAAAGYLILWSIYHLFKLLTGKEGMGYGDFKLLGALGAWLGWQSLLDIVLVSASVGSAVGITLMLRGRDRNVPIPFGPFLAAAGWIALMWGDRLPARLMLAGTL